MAVKLWGFLQTYDIQDKDEKKDIMNNEGDESLTNFLDYSFLVDYYVLDAISKSKREQKEKLSKYAILMITNIN